MRHVVVDHVLQQRNDVVRLAHLRDDRVEQVDQALREGLQLAGHVGTRVERVADERQLAVAGGGRARGTQAILQFAQQRRQRVQQQADVQGRAGELRSQVGGDVRRDRELAGRQVDRQAQVGDVVGGRSGRHTHRDEATAHGRQLDGGGRRGGLVGGDGAAALVGRCRERGRQVGAERPEERGQRHRLGDAADGQVGAELHGAVAVVDVVGRVGVALVVQAGVRTGLDAERAERGVEVQARGLEATLEGDARGGHDVDLRRAAEIETDLDAGRGRVLDVHLAIATGGHETAQAVDVGVDRRAERVHVHRVARAQRRVVAATDVQIDGDQLLAGVGSVDEREAEALADAELVLDRFLQRLQRGRLGQARVLLGVRAVHVAPAELHPVAGGHGRAVGLRDLLVLHDHLVRRAGELDLDERRRRVAGRTDRGGRGARRHDGRRGAVLIDRAVDGPHRGGVAERGLHGHAGAEDRAVAGVVERHLARVALQRAADDGQAALHGGAGALDLGERLTQVVDLTEQVARRDADDGQLGVQRPGGVDAGEVLDDLGDLVDVVEEDLEHRQRAAHVQAIRVAGLPRVVGAAGERLLAGERGGRERADRARRAVGQVVERRADRGVREVGGAVGEHRGAVGAGVRAEQVGHRVEAGEQVLEARRRGDGGRARGDGIPGDGDAGRRDGRAVQRGADGERAVQLQVQRRHIDVIGDAEQQLAQADRVGQRRAVDLHVAGGHQVHRQHGLGGVRALDAERGDRRLDAQVAELAAQRRRRRRERRVTDRELGRVGVHLHEEQVERADALAGRHVGRADARVGAAVGTGHEGPFGLGQQQHARGEVDGDVVGRGVDAAAGRGEAGDAGLGLELIAGVDGQADRRAVERLGDVERQRLRGRVVPHQVGRVVEATEAGHLGRQLLHAARRALAALAGLQHGRRRRVVVVVDRRGVADVGLEVARRGGDEHRVLRRCEAERVDGRGATGVRAGGATAVRRPGHAARLHTGGDDGLAVDRDADLEVFGAARRRATLGLGGAADDAQRVDHVEHWTRGGRQAAQRALQERQVRIGAGLRATEGGGGLADAGDERLGRDQRERRQVVERRQRERVAVGQVGVADVDVGRVRRTGDEVGVEVQGAGHRAGATDLGEVADGRVLQFLDGDAADAVGIAEVLRQAERDTQVLQRRRRVGDAEAGGCGDVGRTGQHGRVGDGEGLHGERPVGLRRGEVGVEGEVQFGRGRERDRHGAAVEVDDRALEVHGGADRPRQRDGHDEGRDVRGAVGGDRDGGLAGIAAAVATDDELHARTGRGVETFEDARDVARCLIDERVRRVVQCGQRVLQRGEDVQPVGQRR